MLLKHRSRAIRQLAEQLLASAAANPRKQVVAAYESALELAGDQDRGAQVFQRECLACHRMGEEGHAIGPNLAASPSRDPAALLVHILDPNQYVLPDYIQYALLDRNGRTFTGMIAAQTATSVTLKREKDATETLLRQNIEEMVSTDKSLMPDGFEQKINVQQMADLLAYLQAAHSGQAADEPPLDIGTIPGLVEPNE